ncbi:PDI, partial [Symbiodinium necroappetens]
VNAKHRGALRPMRQRAVGALKELKRRWRPVGTRLRARQPQALQRATQQRDLGLTALLIILASWGDVTYAHGLVKGLPAVGFAPPYGVFPVQRATPIGLEEVLGDWQKHNAETIRRLKPGRLDQADLAVARAEDSWQIGGEVYAGLLFGLPLAVTSFNRYSRLVEALGRRLVLTMVSLYFDDATVGDWASSKGSGQWAFGQLNALLGTPFAESKRQPMSHRGDFLGLAHDMSRALSDGVVHFWPRDRIVQKVKPPSSTAS